MKIETIISHEYLLSATAIRIWQTNDEEGQNRMLLCITDTCKEKWFRGMIYNNTIIPSYQLQDIAEDAFYAAWEDFNKRGKAGKIEFTEVEYTSYFKQVVRRIFFKMQGKAIKEREIMKEYARLNITPVDDDKNREEIIQKKIQKTFNRLTAKNVSILKWRYQDGLSYDKIAQNLKILKKSCEQKSYRAKQDFIQKWKSDNK